MSYENLHSDPTFPPLYEILLNFIGLPLSLRTHTKKRNLFYCPTNKCSPLHNLHVRAAHAKVGMHTCDARVSKRSLCTVQCTPNVDARVNACHDEHESHPEHACTRPISEFSQIHLFFKKMHAKYIFHTCKTSDILKLRGRR